MSLKYGLKANILKIKDEIDIFNETKKIEDIKIFDFVLVLDNKNESIISTNAFLNEKIKAHLNNNYNESFIFPSVENDFLKIYIVKSILINGNKVGNIVAKLNFGELFNKFIINDKYKETIYVGVGNIIFDDKYLMKVDKFKQKDFSTELINNSGLSIFYNYKVDANFYNSNIFVLILIFISMFLYLLIYYIFHINSKNIILRAKMNDAEKLNRLLEDKVKIKTKQLEEFNKKLKQKVSLEVSKNRKNQSIIYNQSKMAMMGQMLDNIAHQWRQPLSAISTNASFIKLQDELDILDNKSLISTMDNILMSTNFLSETIEDFRSFLRENKKKEIFNVKDIYVKTKKLLISVTRKSDVVIIENIEDINIYGYSNELVQVLLNLINNSYDAFLDVEDEKKKFIFVDIFKDDSYIVLKIKDNATGIPKEIIDNIFDAHFTTKISSNGTGIGLFMTKEIINNNMKGSIDVYNVEFAYENVACKGVEFIIKLPISI